MTSSWIYRCLYGGLDLYNEFYHVYTNVEEPIRNMFSIPNQMYTFTNDKCTDIIDDATIDIDWYDENTYDDVKERKILGKSKARVLLVKNLSEHDVIMAEIYYIIGDINDFNVFISTMTYMVSDFIGEHVKVITVPG